MTHPDLLSTQGLLEAGVVDVLWNNGWRQPTTLGLHAAQHGLVNDHTPPVTLPGTAVISTFCSGLPLALSQVAQDGMAGFRYIFVVRDGDPSIREWGGPRCNVHHWPAFVHHVFGINVIEAGPRFTPMPMGFHAYSEGATQVQHVADTVPRQVRNRVLVSHSVDAGGVTGKTGHERLTAINYFRDKPWATVSPPLLAWRPGHHFIVSPWPWDEYATLLRQHEYLVCPIGYGADRIAGWEAIALGAIPICLKHPELTHFADTPMAFVDRWEDVTPEWCDANLGRINNSTEKLTTSYWAAKIRAKAAELAGLQT